MAKARITKRLLDDQTHAMPFICGAAARQVFRARDAVRDPRQRQTEPDADVAQHVKMLLRPEQFGDQHPRRGDDQDVEGNDDVGDKRAEGRDQHARAIISEKAR